jgi:hypothetical protein
MTPLHSGRLGHCWPVTNGDDHVGQLLPGIEDAGPSAQRAEWAAPRWLRCGAYLLKQHVATAARHKPGLKKKRVSPHVLRHTCAMIVLQATGDIRKVSLWLGHATLTTTEVYTRGDPTEKLDAMEAIVPPHLRRGTFQPSDKLLALLKRTS